MRGSGGERNRCLLPFAAGAGRGVAKIPAPVTGILARGRCAPENAPRPWPQARRSRAIPDEPDHRSRPEVSLHSRSGGGGACAHPPLRLRVHDARPRQIRLSRAQHRRAEARRPHSGVRDREGDSEARDAALRTHLERALWSGPGRALRTHLAAGAGDRRPRRDPGRAALRAEHLRHQQASSGSRKATDGTPGSSSTRRTCRRYAAIS